MMDSFLRQKRPGETREEYVASLQELVAWSIAREFPKPPIPPKPLSKQALNDATTAQQQQERYKKTGGAADGAGENYECKMLTLVFLRLLVTDYEFKLASNMEEAGLFDDIVLTYRQRPDDAWKATYLQLKHKQKRSVSKPALLGLSGDFGLVKYCASYVSLRSAGVHRFIIFTNASVSEDLVDKLLSDRLLDTGGKAVSFKPGGEVYRELCEWVDFKETLTELHGQVDGLHDDDVQIRVTDVLKSVAYRNKAVTSCKDELLKSPTSAKLEELLKKLSPVSDKAVYASFLAELQVYTDQAHESELDARIKDQLERVWFRSGNPEAEVMLYALKDRIKTWWQKENVFLTRDSPLWLEVVRLQTEALSKTTVDALTMIPAAFHDDCLRVLHSAISRAGIVNLRVDSRTAASSLKVRHALARDPNVLHVNVAAFLAREDDVLSAWATRWCRVLVLECDIELDRKQAARIGARVLQVVARDDGKLLVLIAPEKHALNAQLYHAASYTYFNDNFVWNDLTEDTKDLLLSSRVFFNGVRSSHKLSELLRDDKGFANKADLEVFSQLLQGDLSCGQDFDSESAFFVTRRLQALRDGSAFVVNSVRDVPANVVLVAAEPGMGKSTLIAHLAKSAKAEDPSAWVVLIKLNDCTRFLKEIDAEHFDEAAGLRFLEQAALSPGNRLQKLLLGSLGHRLVVFVDGVDEVCPYYEAQVFALLRFLNDMKLRHLWVASRPVFQTKLQNTLREDAHALVAFSSEDRTQFFNEVWKAKVPSATVTERTEAVGSLLSWLDASLGVDNPILGIPLMNVMIAETFLERRGSKLDVVNLYESFVEKKFDLYVNEKKKAAGRELAATRHDEATLLKQTHRNHRLAALRVLFGPKEISDWEFPGKERFDEDLASYLQEITDGREKMGIIDNVVDGVPHFIHRSFAEYFAATWLVENFKTNRALTGRILFDPAYELVGKMFHRSLAAGHPLHVAVCDGDLDALKSVLATNVDELDVGGRTPLNLAVLLSGFDRHYGYAAIIEFLLRERNARLDVCDEVLSCVPLRSAEMSGAWEALEIIVAYIEEAGKGGVAKMVSGWPKTDARTMLDAARDASVAVVRYLVKERGGKMSSRGPEGDTMMHRAVEGGRVPVINYVLKKGLSLFPFFEFGVDLDAVNDSGLTALQVAAQKGRHYAVTALLEEKASYNASSAAGKVQLGTSLLCAAYAGNLASVKTLLEKGAATSYKDDDGHTATWIAMRQEFVDVMNCLLLWGTQDGIPLVAACRQGLPEVAFAILSRGADVKGSDSRGQTPLAAAVLGNHVDVVRLLLEQGADVGCRDEDGRTALHHASAHGNDPVAALLLSHGADVAAEDCEGQTALHLATTSDNGLAMATLLLENWASVDHRDLDGRTALLTALGNENEEIVDLLLRSGADIAAEDVKGQCPLHVAASFDSLPAAMVLLAAGASVDRRDKFGWTALHYAALKDSVRVATVLLSYGAEIEVKDNKGRTAMHVAVSNDNVLMTSLLLEREAGVGCRDEDGWTPLHHAAWKGSERVAAVLLNQGVDVNAKDNMDRTPFMLARMCRHQGIVDLLT